MSVQGDLLLDHLGLGVTTVCRAWSVERTDGETYGFTDHDRDFAFDGFDFKASTGMTARALQQTTGLSVDNTEGAGALSNAAITEADLVAGRFDGAQVRAWLVNWADVGQRIEQFRGSFGEVVRSGGAFKAELRGLTDLLNRPQGRIFQQSCSAVLGDAKCRFDLNLPNHRIVVAVGAIDLAGKIRIAGYSSIADRWFERGRLLVLSGAAQGLIGVIKNDRASPEGREIDLWFKLGAELQAGDQIQLESGCDRQAGTCQSKYANLLNFRGFPTIPGEDWLSSYPVSTTPNDGGSLG